MSTFEFLWMFWPYLTLRKKWSFPWSISSVNVTKSAVSCRFDFIYRRNPSWKTSFFVQCKDRFHVNIGSSKALIIPQKLCNWLKLCLYALWRNENPVYHARSLLDPSRSLLDPVLCIPSTLFCICCFRRRAILVKHPLFRFPPNQIT